MEVTSSGILTQDNLTHFLISSVKIYFSIFLRCHIYLFAQHIKMCDSKSRTYFDTVISTAIAAKPATTEHYVSLWEVTKHPTLQSVAQFVVIIQHVEAFFKVN